MKSAERITPGKAFVSIIVLIGLLGFPLFVSGPQLMSDRAVKKWRPAPELTVKSANCDVWYYLVSTCEIEYVDEKTPNVVRPSLNYLVYGSWGDEKVTLMRAVEDPSKVSISIALRDLSARMRTVYLFFAFIALAIFGLFKQLLQASNVDDEAPQAEERYEATVSERRTEMGGALSAAAPQGGFGRRR